MTFNQDIDAIAIGAVTAVDGATLAYTRAPMNTSEFFGAMELTVDLRRGFATLAKLYGPHRAFEIFASRLITGAKDDAHEEKLVRPTRALYDEYVTEIAGPERP